MSRQVCSTSDKELEHEWPSYLAYVTSFPTVGGVWIAHHRACRRLRFSDSTMMRLNLLLLMTTAFLPFPTGILAEALRAPEHTAETAVFLYGATVLVIEVVLQAFAHRASSRTADGHEPPIGARPLWHRWWLTPSLVGYLIAICVGLVGFPKIGAVLYLLLAIPGLLLIQVHRRPLHQNAPA
ncbi:MAG: TMEM175 family protein [Solirubrobacteraceae bacterium]